MKKNFKFAILGAIALVGAVNLTSCSSSDDVAEVNPGYNSETNEVPINFVFNIANNASSSTRQGTTAVQEGTTFRGMNNVKLFSFVGTSGYVTRNAAVSKYYDMDDLLSVGSITSTASHRILNMSIPVGSNAMLFYGKAPSPTSEDEKCANGYIDYNITFSSDNKLTTHFKLKNRLETTESANLEATEDLAAAILTDLLNVSTPVVIGGATTDDSYTWAQACVDYKRGSNAELVNSMGAAYDKWTTIGEEELRAGSAEAIILMVQDLKNTLDVVTNATPTTDAETTAWNLASAAATKWNSYFQVVEGILKFKPVSNITGTGGPLASSATTSMKAVTDTELNGFPQCYGLPSGSSVIVWNSTKFEYRRGTNVGPLTTGLLIKDKIMYPAELTYYCNGGLRTSNVAKAASGYPDGATNWANNSNDLWTDFSGTSVSSSTMAVALKPNVNYGVALLNTTVKLDANVSNFEDNRAACTEETTNATIAKSDLNLELKGVLVGGQCEETGWDFTRRIPNTDETGSAGAFDYIIYDSKMAGGSSNLAVPTTATSTSPNYTLVFDNYNSGKADDATQDKVKVALELVNKGAPFWGKNNLIGTNSTFYLVGELDPETSTTILTWNADPNYQVPPINESTGESKEIKRVFIQDYMTNAVFTIGATSLQNAYVTVPDLRSTQMTFGLSVDISWRSGLEFNVGL